MRDGREVIVVADDAEVSRTVIAEALQDSNYDVIQVENGKEAWDYMNQHMEDIDLLITDIMMPAIDGFELLRLMKLSKVLKHVPVIMITAIDERENETKAIESGAEDIVMKPFDSHVLAARVKNVLSATHSNGYLNIMEELVDEKIDECIDSLGICKCPICRHDLATLTLNHLKPKYVTSEKGRLMSQVDKMNYNYVAEVVSTIAECAQVIKKNPSHPITKA